MSAQPFGEDLVFLQRFLKCARFYDGGIDGVWGPETDRALDAFESASDDSAARLGTFDRSSERCIRTLDPRAQDAARRFLRTVLDAGIDVRILSGTRTYAEQNGLYKKGRFGNPPPVVTKARGGQSNHNFGIAWDIGVFDNGKYLGESPLYDRAAEVGLQDGLEWGGHWKTFKDRPHYQLKTGGRISDIRVAFENGAGFLPHAQLA